jgi:hypothetical protein
VGCCYCAGAGEGAGEGFGEAQVGRAWVRDDGSESRSHTGQQGRDVQVV